MKRLILLLLEVVLIFSVGLAVYFNYRDKSKPGPYRKLAVTRGKLHFLTQELEEKLVFYLARQLAVYEGSFEVVDVVNLDMRDMTGFDYILVTVKAPNGRLYQVTLSKGFYPWAKWEIVAESSRSQEASSPLLPDPAENKKWETGLGITSQEVREYYLGHPQLTQEEAEAAFLDKETGMQVLPADWKQTASVSPHFILEISKDKSFRFVSGLSAENAYDSYWKVDYPSAYSGPGYRAYLYDKVKGSRK
jgi:hypothetical protein